MGIKKFQHMGYTNNQRQAKGTLRSNIGNWYLVVQGMHRVSSDQALHMVPIGPRNAKGNLFIYQARESSLVNKQVVQRVPSFPKYAKSSY